MGQATENLAEGEARATAESLAEMWAALDHAQACTEDADECETCQANADEYGVGEDEIYEWIHERPLDIEWEKGEPFAVVLGVGGPHTEITGGGRAERDYSLTTYWGSDRFTTRSEAITRTGEFFRDCVEETGR